MTDGLKPEHRKAIVATLAAEEKVERAVLFGSRATQTHSTSSDVDVALFGEHLTLTDLADLSATMDEIPMAQSVDLLLHRSIDNQALLKHVQEQGIELYRHDTLSLTDPREIKQYNIEGWRDMMFSEAVQLNPKVRLERGITYPFVDMAAVVPNSPCVHAPTQRKFTGGGSRFLSGDTLMARLTQCLEKGKVARYCSDNQLSVAHGSTEFIVVRAREGITDTLFSYYLTRWEKVRQYAIDQRIGTTRQRVSIESLDHLKVPVPSLSEQHAIAHILGTLDDKIELNRRMSEILEAMVRALFKSWFVDFDPVRAKMEGRDTALSEEVVALFPSRLVNSELGEIPEGWKVSTIGEEVNAVGGGTPNTKKPVYWNGGIHSWVTPKDLSKLTSSVLLKTDRKITDAGLSKTSSGLLPVGTVLLSSRAPIGYLAIAEIPTAVNQGFIAMICKKQLSNLFVLYWCYENLNYIKSISGGSTFSEISKKVFRSIPVRLPPQEILRAYEYITRPLYDRIIANTKEINLLAQIRDVLLPKLMSGEVCLRENVKILETIV